MTNSPEYEAVVAAASTPAVEGEASPLALAAHVEPPPDPPHLAFLRPYQREILRRVSAIYTEAVAEMLKQAIEDALRWVSVVVVAVTGAGKGDAAVAMIVEALARGLCVMFVVHRTEILLEIERRLRRFGVERISLIVGDAPNRYDPGARVHLANISSLAHRVLPNVDLLIEDECHRVLSPSYVKMRERLSPRFICGFTATPVRLDKKPLCLAYDHLVVAVQPSVLIAAGWLALARVFSTPKDKRPDVSDVETRGGDFAPDQLARAANKRELVGDIVEHWLRRAVDLVTIVFACDIAHSKAIVAAFMAAGIAAEHVDGELDGPERQAVMQRLRDGTTRVCVCASLWLEGIDLPELKCVVLARPTLSLTVYLQGCGRVMRPYHGLNAIVLDHAGNVERHGLPQADRKWDIKPQKRRKKSAGGDAPTKRCPGLDGACGAEVALGTRVCPECGHEFPPQKALETVDGELVEVTKETAAREASEKARRASFDRIWREAYREGHDVSWTLRRFAERFGDAPPTDWSPPPRPENTDTPAQRQARLLAWMGVAQRKRLSHGWVTEKYRLVYGTDPPPIAAAPPPAPPPRPAPAAPDAPTTTNVKLEF